MASNYLSLCYIFFPLSSPILLFYSKRLASTILVILVLVAAGLVQSTVWTSAHLPELALIRKGDVHNTDGTSNEDHFFTEGT